MSSIHYKFKATLEYKTLSFDGLHISVNELKREICEKENIKADSFDLILTNAHTKRQYVAEELVPRNSSVIVQRTPRDNASKLPKIQDTANSGIVVKPVAEPNFVTHIDSDQYEKMTENERLAHVKEVSSYKYSPANFQKKTSSIMSGPPPPTYICNRCSQPGHWYKNCPMLNTRRTTGITMEELMETTSDDPLAMLHSSGKYMVPIMHWKARQQKKVESTNNVEQEVRLIPEEFTCFLCKQLLRDAVVTTCCGESFCAECIQQCLLESSNAKCPGAGCYQMSLSADKLVPNIKVRQAVEAFKNAPIGSHNTLQSSASFPNLNDAVKNLSQQEKSAKISENAAINSPRFDEQPSQPSRVRIELGSRSQQPQQPVVQQNIPHIPQEPQPATYIAQPTDSASTVVSVTAVTALPSAVPISAQVSVPVAPLNIPVNTHNSPLASVPHQNALFPINLSQPPPGYAPMPLNVPGNVDSSIRPPGSRDNTLDVMNSLNHPHFYCAGIQPPPPGLSAPIMFPRVAAPPPAKDAWDEFIERKEKEKIAHPQRHRRSARSSSSSTSETSSSSSSESSRSRSRSWSRERSRRNRRRSSRERRNRSRSPLRGYISSHHHRDVAPFAYYQHHSQASLGIPVSHHRIPSILSGFQSSQLAYPLPNQLPYPHYGAAVSSAHRSFRNSDERTLKRRSPRYSGSERKRRTSQNKERVRERKDYYKHEDVKKKKRDNENKSTENRKATRDTKDESRGRLNLEINLDSKGKSIDESDLDGRKSKQESSPRKIAKVNSVDQEKDNDGTGDLEPNFDKVQMAEIVVKDSASNSLLETEIASATPDEVVLEYIHEPDHEINEDNDILKDESQNIDDNHISSMIKAEDEELSSSKTKDREESVDKAERKSRKKKRKKRRKHKRLDKHHEEKRHHSDDGDRKSKKHKRSREEKEKRKYEKEKRREERRRRKEKEKLNTKELSEDITIKNLSVNETEENLKSVEEYSGSSVNKEFGGKELDMAHEGFKSEESNEDSKRWKKQSLVEERNEGKNKNEKRTKSDSQRETKVDQKNSEFSVESKNYEGRHGNKREKKEKESGTGDERKIRREMDSRRQEIDSGKEKHIQILDRGNTEKNERDTRKKIESNRSAREKEENMKEKDKKERDIKSSKYRFEFLHTSEPSSFSAKEANKVEKKNIDDERNSDKESMKHLRKNPDKNLTENVLDEIPSKIPRLDSMKRKKGDVQRSSTEDDKTINIGRLAESKEIDVSKPGQSAIIKNAICVEKSTVESKSVNTKKINRESVFENSSALSTAMPVKQFNARQKIKMILLSENERFAKSKLTKK